MSYQLGRLRLMTIGERAARFPDTTLDLAAPTSALDAQTSGDPLDSIVWLRNGGGKSSLLSLLFALVLPLRRDFLGLSMKRYIEDYVGNGDTSHTIAEWVDVSEYSLFGSGGGPRLVTGAIYEWDERRKPADPDRNRDKLKAHYYAFFATPGVLTLDTLPLRDPVTGAPTSRTELVKALREIGVQHPLQLQMVVTDLPTAWMQTLADRNLDPELFKYQKKMNHSEGGVADLFNFDTSAKFIDFLIDLIIDSAQPDKVAANLRAVADVLASKPRHLLGREFCITMVGRLDVLAAEQTSTEGARNRAAQVRAAASALSASLTASQTAHQVRQEELGAQLQAAEEAQADLIRDRSRLTALANELLLRAARFREQSCAETLEKRRQLAGDARDTVDAWSAAGPLAEQADAAARADDTRRTMAEQEQANAPRREQRDAAALALRTRYASLRSSEQDELDTVTGELGLAQQRSTQLREEQREQRAALVGHQLRAQTLHSAVEVIERDVAAAVSRGDLPDADGDPQAQIDLRTGEQTRLLDERAQAAMDRQARREQRTALSADRDALVIDRTEHASALEQVELELRRLRARTGAMRSHPRLLELTQLEDGMSLDMWAEASTLRAALTRAAADSDAAVVNSGVDAAENTRALAALESAGYLPTTRDSERIGAVLRAAGVSARPGWELVRDLIAAPDREQALRSPQLAAIACGLVVDADDAEGARQVLADPAVTAIGYVSVATAEVAEAVVRAAADCAWAATAPTPALYDVRAADAARTDRMVAAQTRAQTEQAWIEQARADRALLAVLEQLLTDCPAGYVATLESEIASAAEGIVRLDKRIATAAAALRALDDADGAADAREVEFNQALDALVQQLSRLKALASQVASRPGLAEQLAEQVDATQTVADEVATLEHQATASEDAERELEGRRADATAAVRRYTDQAAKISLLGGTHAAQRAAAGPVADDTDDTLDLLQGRFEQAERNWQQVAATSVLAERLRTQTERHAAATVQLASSTDEARQRAAALLRTASGQDDDGRRRALTLARTAHEQAAADVTRAEVALIAAQDEVADAELTRERERRPVELEQEPRDQEHARQLAAQAAATGTHKSNEVTALNRKMEQHRLGAAMQERLAGLFGQYVQRLAFAVGTDSITGTADDTGGPADAPFDGSHEEAEAAVGDALTQLSAADEDVRTAVDKLGKAVLHVRRAASDSRFVELESPLKDRFTSDDPALLAQHATGRAADLRARRQQIEGLLADISTDQRLVVTQVATLVTEVLATLASAQRHSQLPAALGDWSNKQFLTIGFSKPASDEDLRARIDAVIEQVVADQNKPEGLALLKRCVHEAVAPRGFKVTVLKPNSDLAVEPLDITLLGKYSGGEKLTVCVALYCTLARLRAVNRGLGHVGGTLVLDNPLGTASHVALLRLQRDVAAAHDVQLVYTTGVEDLGAVGQFPNVIRLRNSAGSLRHRRYVTVDGRSVNGQPVTDRHILTQPGDSDGISGVRVTRTSG